MIILNVLKIEKRKKMYNYNKCVNILSLGMFRNGYDKSCLKKNHQLPVFLGI